MPGHEIRDCHNEICFNCDQPGHKSRVNLPPSPSLPLKPPLPARLPMAVSLSVCPAVQDCHQPHRARIYCNYCNKVGHTIQVMHAHETWTLSLGSQECDASKYKKLTRSNNLSKRVYCYSCGEEGHFGFDCRSAPHHLEPLTALARSSRL
jgi:hypothetical protein